MNSKVIYVCLILNIFTLLSVYSFFHNSNKNFNLNIANDKLLLYSTWNINNLNQEQLMFSDQCMLVDERDTLLGIKVA